MRIYLIIKFFLCLLVCLPMYSVVVAQIDSSNVWQSTSKKDYPFSVKKIVFPVSLGVVGATGMIPRSPLNKLSCFVHEEIGRHSFHTVADDWLQYMPIALYGGLSFTSLNGMSHSKGEVALKAVIAYTSTIIMTNGIKYSMCEKRPDSNKHNSFPSGHTATAFTGAELVRLEYGNVYGSLAYVVALMVGSMRVYNDRHWVHDVVSGAGIGILSARIGHWLCPDFKKSDKKTAISFNPYLSIDKEGSLLCMSISF